mmetsp:Transcript_3462/g.8969  ORF Transcript_3462/g.8969 Transcript_3462/m.8969 type:complete len:136 (+) Transcript_3462:32-439(+)
MSLDAAVLQAAEAASGARRQLFVHRAAQTFTGGLSLTSALALIVTMTLAFIAFLVIDKVLFSHPGNHAIAWCRGRWAREFAKQSGTGRMRMCPEFLLGLIVVGGVLYVLFVHVGVHEDKHAHQRLLLARRDGIAS